MNQITVETTINAPLQKVWDMWTMPEHITKWNYASDDWGCPKAENDVQVGGNFSFTMAAKDGSASFDFAGTYTEVTPIVSLAYVFGDRTAQVSFAQEGDTVRVVETFDPEAQNPEEMQRAGWQSILNNFKNYVENN
jgi:uncharacterized protein YndB with AHSA1/START domain